MTELIRDRSLVRANLCCYWEGAAKKQPQIITPTARHVGAARAGMIVASGHGQMCEELSDGGD